MTDSWERARRVLGAAGVPPGDLVRVRPLGGGTYNLVEELTLADGTRHVLKTAPRAPGLSHERQLLLSEADFYGAAAKAGVAAPRVVVLDGDTLLMTRCPGEPWDDTLTDPDITLLRTELGRVLARLHGITGPGFGYPSGALGPLAPDWRTAFTTLYAAVLDDARRYDAWLPLPAADIARTARSAHAALDEVTVPCAVHFDLWRGNILVDRTGGTPRIGGLVDGERMFWGDPLADFVSLALLGDIRNDEAFLAGYRAAGGRARFDRSDRLRYALYRSYLYLIMLVEAVPREFGEEENRWRREKVGPELIAALGEIDETASTT